MSERLHLAKKLSGALASGDLRAAGDVLPAVMQLVRAESLTDAAKAERAAIEAEWHAAYGTGDVARIVAAGQRLIATAQAAALEPAVLTGAQCTWPPPRPRGIGAHLAIGVGRPTAIVSPGGAGKGMLAIALAWAVATGDFLGELGLMGDPGPVLWLDYEETLPMLHARHARYRAGLEPVSEGAGDQITYVDCMREGMTLDSPPFVAWLQAELPRHRLCIVDHLTESWSKSLDWNQPEARLPLRVMTGLSDASGCPFVALGHVNKPDKRAIGGSTADRWRGSTALRGAVTSLWVGDETTKPHEARWTHAKCNSGPKSRAFASRVVDDEGGGLRVEIELDDSDPHSERVRAASDRQANIERAVLDYVRANPGANKASIRGGVRGPHAAKDDAVEHLVQSGSLIATRGSRPDRQTYRVAGGDGHAAGA